MNQPHNGETGFIPATDNLPLEPSDAAIFEQAGLLIEGREIYAAIIEAGGTQQHINHFSRQYCNCKPIQGWVSDEKITPADAKEKLSQAAEGLRS